MAIGYAHISGIVHGSVLPSHVLIHPTRRLKLIDWTMSEEAGSSFKNISTEYKDWYPSEVFAKTPVHPRTDIYMAAKCALFLLGSINIVPAKIKNYLELCVSPNNRPHDAWKMHDDFDELLKRVYGKKEYFELSMS